MKSSKRAAALFVTLLSVGAAAEVLSFSKAYEEAVLHSNKVKSAEYMLESNKKKEDMEAAALYPQIKLSVGQTRTEYKYNVKATSLRDPHVSQDKTSLSATFKQQVYDPELYAKIEVEKIRSQINDFDVSMQKQELAKEVFKTYLNILQSKNKIELHKATIAYHKANLQALKDKYAMHLATKVDVLEIEVEHSRAKIDLKKETKMLKVYELMLSHFIGKKDFEMPRIDFAKIDAQRIRRLIASVSLQRDLSSNLELQKALKTKEMIQKEVDSAYYAHYPKINIDAAYSQYEIDNPTVDSSFDNIQNIMITLSVPVYQGGYTTAKVESLRLKKSAAQEDLFEIEKNKRVEYEELMSLLASSAESIDTYNEALESARLYLQTVKRSYESGLKSIIDYHEANTKIYDIQYKYIENIYEMIDAYIGLMTLTDTFENIGLIDDIMRKEG